MEHENHGEVQATKSNFAATDKAPAPEIQAGFDDAVAALGRGNRANGANSGAQEAAEGLDGLGQRQVAPGVNGAQGAPTGPSEGFDPDGSSGVDINDADAGVTELSEDAFNAQLEAQSARNAKVVLQIGRQEFDHAYAADDAQGFHGDGDVELVVAENWNHRLTKSFRASKDGKSIEKDESKVKTGFGRMGRVTLSRDEPITSLATLLTGCRENQAFMPGRLPGDAPMRRMIIKPRFDALPEAERALDGSGPLYRGKLCIGYVPGKPAVLIVDFDVKDLPDTVRERIFKAGGLRAVLASIDPQWGVIGFLERPSVSTGIRVRGTDVVTPGGGLHLYVIVDDGGDLERYVRVMFDRLVLAGFGWITLSTAGSCLTRSPIDKAASGIGYWLAFEANAVLEIRPHGNHLEHVTGARRCEGQEGPQLDTRALPDLTEDQRRQVADIWAELKAEKEPEARAIRLARGAKDIARLVKAGVTQHDAERLVLERDEMGRLSLDATYWFDEKLPSGSRSATGWELLENATEWFAGGRARTGADPEEPDYPNVGSGVVAENKGWWKLNDHSRQAGLFVSSRAHGGRISILAYDAADVVALMDDRKAQGASAIVRLAELKAIYRQTYLPADQPLAEKILRKAGLPRPIVLEFGDHDEPDDAPQLGELARERLIDVLRDQDWDQLVRLRCLGRFRDEALAELQGDDENFGLGFDVDWRGLTARLAAADKAAKADLASSETPEDHLAGGEAALDTAAKFRNAAVVQRPWTEDALTLAFKEAHGEHLRYDHDRGRWFVLHDGRWRPDMPWLAFRWARGLARSGAMAASKKPSADLSKIKTARAVELAVRSDAPFAVNNAAWDLAPLLLGVPGGVIDLRTTELMPPDARHMITRQALVSPAPRGTPTPIWDGFLDQAMGGDQDLAAFTHHWFGYCLSGDTSWEIFVFAYGKGGNGKGVVRITVTRIAGDYAQNASMETFMERRHSVHDQEIARMAGARMVTASETADGCAFNLARLKEHTGNEGKLTAHFMRRDNFDFQPTHKLSFFGNHHPRVAHVDDAIRRRAKLLPFLHRPAVPDETLKKRLLPEYPGILRKLIDHGAEVHAALAQGNNKVDRLVPQAVRAASDAYLDGEDVVLAWVRCRTRLDPKGRMTATEAYTDHQNWASDEGRAPFSKPRLFSEKVVAAVNDSRCFVDHKEKGATIMGISLVPEGSQA